MDRVELVLKLNVSYSLNGVDKEDLMRLLTDIVERAVGHGLLTGDSKAEVESWNVSVYDKEDEGDL